MSFPDRFLYAEVSGEVFGAWDGVGGLSKIATDRHTSLPSGTLDEDCVGGLIVRRFPHV